ncbi:MAG: Gfo/Idh/MocA family oxidoreductase [Lachnospiraceae bacterium]|nr:Gfo/Idh/MocA family oxidoreductase [Lachnospiraceae bacterium]
MKETRWAIVGTGYIANEFAKGMQEAAAAELVAVVSRSEENGKAFAQRYGCNTVYTELAEMLQNARPDIVYIAIPNDCHFSYIMTVLEAGIPVLSEKPMVDNRRQLDAVLAKAREKDVFLMEGMWTRCFPAVRHARSWIAEGKIGKPLTVKSGFDIKPDVSDWQPWKGGISHAGGALRDVGIYALAMAQMVFPESPKETHATMKSNGEVDESFHMLATYTNGRAAFLSGAFNQVSTPVTEIVGELGRILIGPEFWHPTTAELVMNDGTRQTFEKAYPESGFQYEIEAIQECLEKGEKECPYFTLTDTEIIADWIETTRKEWGIVYKADSE